MQYNLRFLKLGRLEQDYRYPTRYPAPLDFNSLETPIVIITGEVFKLQILSLCNFSRLFLDTFGKDREIVVAYVTETETPYTPEDVAEDIYKVTKLFSKPPIIIDMSTRSICTRIAIAGHDDLMVDRLIHISPLNRAGLDWTVEQLSQNPFITLGFKMLLGIHELLLHDNFVDATRQATWANNIAFNGWVQDKYFFKEQIPLPSRYINYLRKPMDIDYSNQKKFKTLLISGERSNASSIAILNSVKQNIGDNCTTKIIANAPYYPWVSQFGDTSNVLAVIETIKAFIEEA